MGRQEGSLHVFNQFMLLDSLTNRIMKCVSCRKGLPETQRAVLHLPPTQSSEVLQNAGKKASSLMQLC